MCAARTGDAAARDELVDSFLPLISAMARHYRRAGLVDRAELVQEGVGGLLRALKRYDPAYGPFWPYAVWWVRQAMQRLVAELSRPIVLSDRALRQLARIKTARTEHMQAHGAEPSIRDLAERTGLDRVHVQSLLAVERQPGALGERRPGHDDGALGPFDEPPDPRSEDDYDRVLWRAAADELSAHRDELGERECEVLQHRYGLAGGAQLTLREIGDRLGVSAERVRQIEETALGKLRMYAMSAPVHRDLAASPGADARPSAD